MEGSILRRASHLVHCSVVVVFIFWTGNPRFSFCTEPYKLWSWSWPRLQLSVELSRRDVQADWLTRLAADAGCWLGVALGLSPGVPTRDLSVWPELVRENISRDPILWERPKLKLKCFLWHNLGRPSMTFHLQHMWLVKQIIKTSPDPRVSALNPASCWGVERSHCRRAHGMRHCSVHL